MKQTINIEGVGNTTITDKEYLTSGGQASIYVKSNLAIKIYTDPTQMIPVDKIRELREIKDPSILFPKHIVYDVKGKPIGYAMEFKTDTSPLCKIFTNAFKNRNNVSSEMVSELIAKGQQTIQHVHDAKCLIVDLNELNLLLSKGFDELFFIDVDSYQTPSFRATAIMESIKDPKIKGNHWTEGSDWFSYAILSFQMWIGIHPYKGKHPDYAPNEFLKRIEDGISVFDKKVSLPKVCNDFSVVPPSHMKWFKQIFIDGARLAPPSMGDISLVLSVPTAFNVISASGSFEIEEYFDAEGEIRGLLNFMGVNYYASGRNIYKNNVVLPVLVGNNEKVIICESSGVAPVIGSLGNGMLKVQDVSGANIGETAADDIMYRNGCIYSVYGGKLTESSFMRVGDKIIQSRRLATQVMDLSTKMFDGVILQDMLGKQHITLPYEQGKVSTLYIKELDGYRILDARSEKNVCVVMASNKNKYHRFVLTFDAAFNQYTIRHSEDVDYSDANVTVLPNGVSILSTNDQVEIFRGDNVKVVDNPPFNASTKLFNLSGVIHYVDGKKIMKAKMKK